MRYLFLSIFFIVSFTSQATENKHNLGISYGIGEMHTERSIGNDDSINQSGLFYEYRFNKNYAVSVKYFDGTDTNGCLCGDNYRQFDFKNYQLTFKANSQLSMRWSFYGRAGINNYETQFEGNKLYDEIQLPNINESGFGQVLATGIEFNPPSGFILAFEIQYLTTKNVDILSHNLSLGYAF